MLKKMLGIAVLAAAAHVYAQNPFGVFVPSAPSGSCANGSPVQVVVSTGIMYTCQNATWGTWGGSGTFTALSGDATSTATGGPTTVKGINGTLLSGLASGFLYNTTTTGVPSIATAAQMNTVLQSLTGCNTAGNVLTPQSSSCVPQTGGGMTWPAAAGIAVYAGANAWGSSLIAPTGAIVGTTDTQTLTNKTVDGVTPATFGFVDPTSSIQTQINSKQGTITLTTTGTTGAATLVGSTLNIPQYSAGSMVYPAAGIAVSTGSAWGSSLVAPTGTIVGTTDTQTLTNKTVDGVTPTTFGFVDFTSSGQTQLNAKAPIASPSFTGTVKIAVTGSTQCLHVDTTGAVSGTGSDCGSGGGGGTVTHTTGALTAGQIVIGNGSADIKVDTGASTDGAGNMSVVSLATSGSGGVVTIPDGGAAAANKLTSAAGVLYWGTSPVTPTSIALQCEMVWGGTGTSNALQTGDDTISNNSCFNETGKTWTITGVYCKSDAASNTTTVNPTYGASGTGTSILAGALTCGSSSAYSATGTLSGTPTIANGNGIDPVMGGTLTGTNIHVLITYTRAI